jgi:hypothetical protein
MIIAPAKFDPFWAIARTIRLFVLKPKGVPFAHTFGEFAPQAYVSVTVPDHPPVIFP